MLTALLVILIALLPIAYSLWQGNKARREIKGPGEFFLYPKEFASKKLRDSITASNVSLGSAIFAFLGFGYAFRFGALVSPLTWLPGYILLLVLFRRVPEIRSGRTLHGYLALRYGSMSLGYLASIASIVGFLGAYGVEVLVAIKLFRVILPSELSDVALALLIAAIVTWYTAMGGFKAASHADGMRLLGTTVGIGIALVYAFVLASRGEPSAHDKALSELASDAFGVGSLTPLFLFSLLVLNLPWQLVDMSVWQRLSACESTKDITKGIRQSIPAIGLLWIALIGLGALLHYIPGFAPPADGDFASAFLAQLKQPFVLAVFVAACIAALMSTADSLLIASVQTLVMDVFFPHREPHTLFSRESAEANPELARRILAAGRKWVWILGLSAPIVIYSLNIIIKGILDLFFLIYSAQLALLVSVVVAVLSRGNRTPARGLAIASVGIGLATAASMFIVMLLRPSQTVFLVAPLLTVGLSLLPWAFYPLVRGSGEETA